jgi:hypothetical protein
MAQYERRGSLGNVSELHTYETDRISEPVDFAPHLFPDRIFTLCLSLAKDRGIIVC